MIFKTKLNHVKKSYLNKYKIYFFNHMTKFNIHS